MNEVSAQGKERRLMRTEKKSDKDGFWQQPEHVQFLGHRKKFALFFLFLFLFFFFFDVAEHHWRALGREAT